MAFDRTLNRFERVAGGLRKIFVYITPDTIATVTASGYFNAAAAELDQFDIMFVIGTTGGTPTFDAIFVTSASRAAVVTTSATEGVTAT